VIETEESIVEAAVPAVRRQVAAHAGVTFIGLMAANVLGYLFYTLVSRTLGVDAYGTFSSLLAVVLILASPALIAQTVVAKLASDLALDPDRLAGLVRAVDRVTLLVATAAAVVLCAAAVPLSHFLHVADPLLVVFAGLSLGCAITLPFMRGVLQGTSAFRAFALSNVAEQLAKALAAPVLGLVAGLRGALAGVAVGYGLAAAYTFIAALPHRRGVAVTFSLRAAAPTSGSVALAVFCINLLLLYDVVLAKRYLDAHTAGLYGAAALASRALFAVTAFIPTVLLPQAATRAARGEATRGLYLQAVGAGAVIVVAAIAFFALFPRFVITTIAGHSFSAGSVLLLPYVYAIGAMSLANITATYAIARGRMRFVAPLCCVVVAEITSVVLRHRTPVDLLQTIAVGHTCALLACAWAFVPFRRGAAPAAARSEAQ
jgi:O-antigen/teichoic acid export membrane protein